MTTYNKDLDPGASANSLDVEIFGSKSRNIVTSDTVDLTPGYAKAIVVTAAGNLSILPVGNTDNAAGYVVFTAAPVGFIPPYRVRRVNATGTTATCSTVDNA
jgi:hypothetical protein